MATTSRSRPDPYPFSSCLPPHAHVHASEIGSRRADAARAHAPRGSAHALTRTLTLTLSLTLSLTQLGRMLREDPHMR